MLAFLRDCFHRISLSRLHRFSCMTSATSRYVRHIEKKKKKKEKKAKQRDIAKYVQSTIKARCVTLRFDDKTLLRDVIIFSGNFLSQRFSLSLPLSVLHFFFFIFLHRNCSMTEQPRGLLADENNRIG